MAQRQAAGLPFGVPDLSRYLELVRQVDAAGFAALWMRDVPVFDPQHFGDAGSVYDPFVNLGFLAGVTQRVALGTAAVVLPLRHPLMVAKAAASADHLSGGRLILGVASGDRPVEYPLMGIDFETRGPHSVMPLAGCAGCGRAGASRMVTASCPIWMCCPIPDRNGCR